MRKLLQIFTILCLSGCLSIRESDPTATSLPVWYPHVLYQSFNISTQPRGVVLSDVNGDGNLDALITHFNATKASIHLGNSSGDFTFSTDLTTSASPYNIVMADVNYDGNKDILVTSLAAKLDVFLSNGDGTFQAKVSYTTAAQPIDIEVKDFDHDNVLDVVTADLGASKVSFLKGNANGTFQAKVDYATGADTWAVKSADLNNDGDLDLVVTNFSDDNFSVLLGNGDGTFQARTNTALTAGDNPTGIVIRDTNNDGNQDILILNYTSNSIKIALGAGNGTFSVQATSYSYGGGGYEMHQADLNNDGIQDLITTSADVDGKVALLIGKADGTFETTQNIAVITGGVNRGMALGKINSDTFLDIVTVDYSNAKLSALLTP